MTKNRKPAFTERMAAAIRSFFVPSKPLHIRLRKRKAGEYWQVCRGREVIRQYSVLTTTLEDVKAVYPRATYTEPKAKP